MILLALSAATCDGAVDFQREFDGAAAMRDIETQMEFGYRVPNTVAHRAAGDWIAERLGTLADTLIVQEFFHVTAESDTLELRNFFARFQPDVARRVLYVAHWDTRPAADKSANIGNRRLPVPGANDGASGVAILLGVAEVLARTPSNYGVDILVVDGEDWGDFGERVDVLLGSRYFAANLPAGYSPMFGVLFDMVGARDARFLKEGYSVSRAPRVVEHVWSVAAEMGYDDVFVPRAGLAVDDDHMPLLDAGLSVISVIGWPYQFHHTREDTVDKLSVETLQAVGDVAVGLLRR